MQLGEEVNAQFIAVEVESELYKCYDIKHYKKRVKAIKFNLCDPQNSDLRQRLVSGELRARELAHLSNEDMASNATKRERQTLEQRALDARRSDWFESRKQFAEGVFECECGSRQTEHSDLQIRSGDEPMTSFIHCGNCDRRWAI